MFLGGQCNLHRKQETGKMIRKDHLVLSSLPTSVGGLCSFILTMSSKIVKTDVMHPASRQFTSGQMVDMNFL